MAAPNLPCSTVQVYTKKGYCAGSNPPGGSPAAAAPRNRTGAPGLVEAGSTTAALLFLGLTLQEHQVPG
jgi:hypothetical protein